VLELQPLRRNHAERLLAFELANRDYFAASVSDRGDQFFTDFNGLHDTLLAKQDAGVEFYYLLVANDGQMMGRFNLYRVRGGTAELGYRVGEQFAGRGVGTQAVQELCRLASSRHHIGCVRAATSHRNIASQRVLLKAGFVETGPADPSELGGQSGTWYQRELN
jgi:[ribosomal protein S5]-alanine N-acetyltransferase